tara:strand:+ start:289 stop:660 length:372 start_codon:yes stop_codon:yes gene_type:complete
LSGHDPNAVPNDAGEPSGEAAESVVVIEDPTILEPVVIVEVEGPSLSTSFYYGLNDGMNAFGFAFPFLMISLLGWLATILWIPFAIRIARGIVRRALPTGYEKGSDAATTTSSDMIERNQKEV